MPARVVVFAMAKGGVAKSSSTVALGWALQQRNKRTLVVDLDGQGSSSAALGVYSTSTDGGYGVREFLLRPEIPVAPAKVTSFLHVVGGKSNPTDFVELSDDVRKLSTRLGGNVVVARAVARVAEDYDFILIDTPPALDTITLSALYAGPVLVPVTPEPMGLQPIGHLQLAIEMLRLGVQPKARILAYLATACDFRTTSFKECMVTLEGQAAGTPVLKSRIPWAEDFKKALSEAQSPYLPKYRSTAQPAYDAALDEFLPLVEAYYQEVES